MRNSRWKHATLALILLVITAGFTLLLQTRQGIAASRNEPLLTSHKTTAPWADRTDLNLITLPAPPFEYQHQLSTSIQSKPSDHLQLHLIQAKPNSITDQEEWLNNNNLLLPGYQVSHSPRTIRENLPGFIPERFRGQILVKAIPCKETILLIYGADFGENRYLVAVDASSGEYRYGFDFINYAYSPEYLRKDKAFVYQRMYWAFIEDDILYVSHAHSTYARSSRGLNAYITAIDSKTANRLWRSRPLVANAENFEIIGHTIITGYGFTNEPDYLYLLDKRTGEVYQQFKLKAGPELILIKDKQLYVRTYNTDYLFAIDRP